MNIRSYSSYSLVLLVVLSHTFVSIEPVSAQQLRRSFVASQSSSYPNSQSSSKFNLLAIRCPALCTCDTDAELRKRVTCNDESLTEIPTDAMDRETQVCPSFQPLFTPLLSMSTNVKYSLVKSRMLNFAHDELCIATHTEISCEQSCLRRI